MKLKGTDAITFYKGENTRLADRIARVFNRIGSYHITDKIPIIDTMTNSTVGYLFVIRGFIPIIRFLSWLTQERSNSHEVKIVEENGRIVEVKES